MAQINETARGATWLAALTGNIQPNSDYPASVRVVDAPLGGRAARFIAVVPDTANRFPRVRNGEVGLVEGWALARAVGEVLALDAGTSRKRPIVAVIDVTSQAYGRREEAYGIHQALAGAAGAYAEARLAGHPVIGLIVGKAMSGGLLAHAYQANRLIALDDPGVMVHAMGKAAAARVTQRSVADLEKLAQSIPPMAYDIRSFASLGLLWKLLAVKQPDAPGAADLDLVETALLEALADIEKDPSRDLAGRLEAAPRAMSKRVRERLRALWQEDRQPG